MISMSKGFSRPSCIRHTLIWGPTQGTSILMKLIRHLRSTPWRCGCPLQWLVAHLIGIISVCAHKFQTPGSLYTLARSIAISITRSITVYLRRHDAQLPSARNARLRTPINLTAPAIGHGKVTQHLHGLIATARKPLASRDWHARRLD